VPVPELQRILFPFPQRAFPSMRTCLSLVVLFGALLPAASAGTLLDLLRDLPKNEVEVVTVTDTTPTGALLRPASPANPVYYMAVSVGFREFGAIIAGEKHLPSTQEVTETITKVLAKHGYLPATDSHLPTLLLVWTWGTMNTETVSGPVEMGNMQINRQQLLRFMGADKVGLGSKMLNSLQQDLLSSGLTIMGHDAQAIYDLAADNLYVAAIAAYDYQAAARKESKLLWTTKISCPARGHWLQEALPTMLAIAGPNIGRETGKPVLISAGDKLKPDIRIGNPTLVEYIGSGKLPVIDASPQAAGEPPPDKK
jgi:hypothetical protein